MSQKKEAPTPRRLARARDEGDVPVSPYASQAVGFCVAVLLIPATLHAIAARSSALLRQALTMSSAPWSVSVLVGHVLSLSVPLVAATAASSALITLVQTGALFAPSRILPDWGRIRPSVRVASGMKWQRLWLVARVAISAVLVGWLALKGLREHLGDLAHTVGRIGPAAGVAGQGAKEIARGVAAFGIALAAIDIVVVRFGYFARLRMSKVEVRREEREGEGDPNVKAARRRSHQELLRMATLHAVRNATVVLTDPQRLAVALLYQDGQEDAPLVVARGEGDMARRIEHAANEAGVPIVVRVALVHALAALEIGDPIAEAHYEATAEVLRELL